MCSLLVTCTLKSGTRGSSVNVSIDTVGGLSNSDLTILYGLELCSISPCKNGATCSQTQNAYSCTCAAGYTGTNCTVNIDDCWNSPCRNGGTCQDGIATYSCVCAVGYTGTNCSV